MGITGALIHLKRYGVCPSWKAIQESRNGCSERTFSVLASKQLGTETHSILMNHAVVLSSSNDIYMNLALEDWIYKNYDFSHHSCPLLMLWRNGPSVVLGRHQNPWTECKLTAMARHGVLLARRNSGGGTVYHDLGNLNCTFFTCRSDYNRKKNLHLICNALRRKWFIDVNVSSREDILLDKIYKISGTAAKLGRTTAYHHCTILFNADSALISEVLRTDPINDVDSKATKSVGSPVKNLRDVIPAIDFQALVEVIGDTFCKEYQVPRLTKILTPCEEQFPGLMEICTQLKSWEWMFGKCPRFTVRKRFPLRPELSFGSLKDVSMIITVSNGLIAEVKLEPDFWMNDGPKTMLADLVGKRFPFQNYSFKESMVNFDTQTKHCEDVEAVFLQNTIKECIIPLL